MQCAEALRVQAYFDGEVDALTAAEIERHSMGCAECRELLQDLEFVRTRMRQHAAPAGTELPRASSALRARILDAIDRESEARAQEPRVPGSRHEPHRRGRTGPFWRGALAGVGGTALAAAMAFFFVGPAANPVLDELLSAHVRSLMPDHLIDVVSTDKHTVKPWFAGHADVSPAVADFEREGYRLVGGRADYLAHQRTAAVVYRHGSHVINVFTWSANGSLPRDTTRSGYHFAFWRVGDLVYCAVSDTGWDELRGLEHLMQGVNAPE
jgi:anti-sigma factor RsiW